MMDFNLNNLTHQLQSPRHTQQPITNLEQSQLPTSPNPINSHIHQHYPPKPPPTFNHSFNFSHLLTNHNRKLHSTRLHQPITRQYALDSGSLHIWPRGTFMLIGLPNVEDHSFVMTLFMPHPIFQSLTSEAKIIAFFKQHFNDALQLITECVGVVGWAFGVRCWV